MGDKETLSSLEVHLCPLPHHHISTIILTMIGSLNKLKNFHLITASFWGLGGVQCIHSLQNSQMLLSGEHTVYIKKTFLY